MLKSVSFEKLSTQVVAYVAVSDIDDEMVTGLVKGDFTIRLINPSGADVSGSLTITVVELGTSGNYKITFTPNALGEWNLSVGHVNYLPSPGVETYLVYTNQHGPWADSTVVSYFRIEKGDATAVTGITAANLTIALYNPSGTEVSSSVTVTITEIGNGLYKASFTSNANGKWLLEIKHAIWFKAGQRDDLRVLADTRPAAPTISAISASGAVITATVAGDDDVTNYVQVYDDDQALHTSNSRSGDGDVDNTVTVRVAFYYVEAYSMLNGLKSESSAPRRVYVSGANESKYESLRVAMRDRLVASTTLATILGTDKGGNVPIYEASNFGAPSTPRYLAYTLQAQHNTDENVNDQREFVMELFAEVKVTNDESSADVLDRIEYEVDDLLDNWGYDSAVWWMEFAARDGMSTPTFNLSDHGYEGRSWRWRFICGEK